MLPTPTELRELSQRLRQVARNAVNIATKKRLARHALALSMVAEQIERKLAESDFVRHENIELYKRVLAQALNEKMRATVDALLSEETKALDKKMREIMAWRMRAEELRTTADQFVIPSAQESIRRAAFNYDKLADHAEAQLGTRTAY
jgi:hypothetical protein